MKTRGTGVRQMLGITIDRVPRKGYLLAYFRDALVFEPYSVEDGRLVFPGWEAWQDAAPVECHLFDCDREYRMVSREQQGDRVEMLFTRQEEEAMEPDLLYEEEPLIREEYAGRAGFPNRLKIVNRYSYSENDTLVLVNYRIALADDP